MAQEDWFKSWFNTPYYHKLYKHRDDNDAQVFMDAIIHHLHLKKGDCVLDLACGRGRHAIYLEKKGFDVYGIDLSEESISFAKLDKTNVHFEVKDMRENFGEDKFDYIFNLFTSFGYFDSNEEHLSAIKNMSSALKPGGILILDFLNACKVEKGLVEDELIESDGLEFRIKRYVEESKIVKEILVKDGIKESRYHEKVALLCQSDFLNFFEKTGLTLVDTFGDMQLSPFSLEDSDRLILMAKRTC